MSAFSCHLDGTILEPGYDRLRDILIERSMLEIDSKGERISFCGILHDGERTHFFWPKTFQPINSDTDVRRYGRLLLDTLSRYSRNEKYDVLSEDSSSVVSGVPPLVALDILGDYQRYGLFTSTEAYIARKSSGNILWNRVIRNSLPLPDNAGRPIYTELYVRKHNYFSSNEITQIHAAIIARLDPLFGWYYSDAAKIAPELEGVRMPCSDTRAIALVKRELRATFSDRQIRLLRNILSILENAVSNDIRNKFFTGITGFAHIWEEMCAKLYGDQQDEFRGLIPYPAYVEDGVVIPAERNRQRMDIIISEGNSVSVLDAKYYDMDRTRPQWSDLVKQFYYAKSLIAVMPDKKVSNFLVCPLPRCTNRPRAEAAVVVSPKDRERLDDIFPPVSIRYHDILEVMESYCRRNMNYAYREEVLAD